MDRDARPPKEGLVRAFYEQPVGIRSSTAGSPRILFGLMAVFDEWTEIDSAYEGHFMERVRPGAFTKTFSERADKMRVLFHHGLDPSIGLRVLGVPTVLEENEAGAYYEAELFDTPTVNELAPGLEAGVYGSSFRFDVIREVFNRFPRKSAHNPAGIPERDLVEVACPEFGPTPFPAYENANAGMRSLTDDLVVARVSRSNGFQVAIPAKYPTAVERPAQRATEPYTPDPDETVECTFCNRMNDPDAVFCDQCGRRLVNPGGLPYQPEDDETVACPNCNCMNDADANFCDQCGYAMDGADTVSAKQFKGGAPLVRLQEPDRRYVRASHLIAETAWLMEPQMLAVFADVLAARRQGVKFTDEEIADRINARAVDREDTPATTGPVSIIDIFGPIVPRADLFSEVSGMTSVEGIQAQFRDALNDPDVKSIMLNIDSPGGSSSLIPELGAEILAARDVKPVTALANVSAGSAAYWLASQASEIVVSPSAYVGSIGVYTLHNDVSGQMEQLGIKPTFVSAGKYKTEGNPFEPLTEEAAGYLQGVVDELYDEFLGVVARGRGVGKGTVRTDFGEGRMVDATTAVKSGMADRIGTFAATVQRLTKTASKPAPATNAASDKEHLALVGEAAPVPLHLGKARRGSRKLGEKEEPSWILH